ncbi:palmitoyl-protein thioesterase 1 [Tieghemostelium lacteum]|uniref:Palmitoyl-protein thioesterase 1 n=1 Tax=Tieghemostelium lacteum TaxID=361077 RepID=A0A151Z964_TIELA|nr:palmitoyl-protein thioesterase 1 [Tieghemostelium lacteum]|eukprot:KYQ90485.1 palmitoyl-protein thioesterase 1 [Tieghemostelium lacteum]
MDKSLILLSIVLIFISNIESQETIRPTVLWHGIGDTCCYPFSMGRMKKLIEANLEGIYVYSVEVGDSIAADEFNSYFMNVNDQIDQMCAKFKANGNLTNGFNAVGFSQGSQFLRAYNERCNDPPIYNLITLGGQHQGVYGLPDTCLSMNGTICQMVRDLLDLGVYESFVQDHLVPAEYWQDSLNYDEYLEKSVFIADINNARSQKNSTYYKNFISLNKLVLVKFNNDTIVIPRESEWFGFYTPGSDKDIQTMEETDLYIEDWIGLRYLDENGQVIKLSTDGNHLQFTDDWFVQNILTPYLNNTI